LTNYLNQLKRLVNGNPTNLICRSFDCASPNRRAKATIHLMSHGTNVFQCGHSQLQLIPRGVVASIVNKDDICEVLVQLARRKLINK